MTCAPHILLEGFVPLPLVERGQGWGEQRFRKHGRKREIPSNSPPPQPSPTRGEGEETASGMICGATTHD